MLLGVDHFVIAVGELAAAVRDYAALGFSVVPGGRYQEVPDGLRNVTRIQPRRKRKASKRETSLS